MGALPDYEVVDHPDLGLILVANHGASLHSPRSLGGRLPNQLRYVPLPRLPAPVDELVVDAGSVRLCLADGSEHVVAVT